MTIGIVDLPLWKGTIFQFSSCEFPGLPAIVFVDDDDPQDVVNGDLPELIPKISEEARGATAWHQRDFDGDPTW